MSAVDPHASIRYWTIGEWREAKIAAAVRADDGFDPEVLEWARRRLRQAEQPYEPKNAVLPRFKAACQNVWGKWR